MSKYLNLFKMKSAIIHTDKGDMKIEFYHKDAPNTVANFIKLIEKGFISFVKEGQRKYYRPSNPEHILSFIDEKRKRFEEIIPKR